MASIERQTGLSLTAGERAISHLPPEGSDFGLEQYKLDRAHELELNKATAEYEHAWLRTITLLNGGAAVGFVTLISAIWKVGEHPWTIFALAAFLMWALGLIFVTYGTHLGLHAQNLYANGYRSWRNVEEVRRYRGDPQRLEVFTKRFSLSYTAEEIDLPDTVHTIAKAYIRNAHKNYKEADNSLYRAKIVNWAAVVLFMIGVALAATSVPYPERQVATQPPDKASHNFNPSPCLPVVPTHDRSSVTWFL